MNFSKLPKEKRNQLIMVALFTAMALGGLGFGLIQWQQDKLRELAEKKEAAQQKLKRMQDAIKRADEVENDLAGVTKTLAQLEDGMASGDLFSWVVNTIRLFKPPYKVEIPSYSQPVTADMNLIAKFPYRQATITVVGQAFYHDFGKFIADFENQFPHIRVVNLSLEPVPGLVPSEKERLEFKMDIVTLIKPNST